MSSDTLAANFGSLKGAQSARERLASAGFGRNSIDIVQHGDEFEVSVHTRPKNRSRARAALTNKTMSHLADRNGLLSFIEGNMKVSLGVAVLAGMALHHLTRD
ncbi:hypothetical protein [Methylobacterium sp. J-092]|uniref:hypothetical protein n=1 Tax=Methylobacterium sp. J-092 TaxID=2836667 RepID=UPI001FBBEE36|nr:hypothetical protein [Methylobacterium sp. J-092]MCJ2007300.1 hypothetical protein [Methylobacterium sp. J-092]